MNYIHLDQFRKAANPPHSKFCDLLGMPIKGKLS